MVESLLWRLSVALTDQEREDVEQELGLLRHMYDFHRVTPLNPVGDRRYGTTVILREIRRLERILEDND